MTAIDNLRENLPNLSGRDAEFASSLLQQMDERGSLSTKQMYWVEKLAASAPAKPEIDDLSGVIKLMDGAADKLRFPKINIQTKGGATIRLIRAGEKSSHPGGINVTDGGDYDSAIWYGRIRRDGSFVPSRDCTVDITSTLAAIAIDPESIASAHGHKTGSCCFCNRGLTDARSTEVGYGPTCADNYGLAWG